VQQPFFTGIPLAQGPIEDHGGALSWMRSKLVE
jgi:hypothetical protein